MSFPKVSFQQIRTIRCDMLDPYFPQDWSGDISEFLEHKGLLQPPPSEGVAWAVFNRMWLSEEVMSEFFSILLARLALEGRCPTVAELKMNRNSLCETAFNSPASDTRISSLLKLLLLHHWVPADESQKSEFRDRLAVVAQIKATQFQEDGGLALAKESLCLKWLLEVDPMFKFFFLMCNFSPDKSQKQVADDLLADLALAVREVKQRSENAVN